MKLTNYIDKYLNDKNYSITIKNNYIHIINYIEINDFSSSKIVIKHQKGNTTIIGNNLIISKMLKDELLITGQIKIIEV